MVPLEKRQQLPARHELKFYVNPTELGVLRTRLRPIMRLDPNCRGGAPYHIRSLYFDDAFDSAYYDKLDGVMSRDKYRIRIYNHRDEEIFLERKRKLGELIAKTSVRITRRLCEQLMARDPRGLHSASNPLLQDVYAQMRTRLLRPTVLVDYRREAYISDIENVRITFDTQLRTGRHSIELFNPDVPVICPHDRAVEILEVKFDRYLPPHIAGQLDGLAADRSAISKYILCRKFEFLPGDPAV